MLEECLKTVINDLSVQIFTNLLQCFFQQNINLMKSFVHQTKTKGHVVHINPIKNMTIYAE